MRTWLILCVFVSITMDTNTQAVLYIFCKLSCSTMTIFTDFLHIIYFLIDFNTRSWHLTSSSYCWMAEILLLLWQCSFSPLLLGNTSLLYLLLLLYVISFLFFVSLYSFDFSSAFTWSLYKSTTHMRSHSFSQIHSELVWATDTMNNTQKTYKYK